MLEVLLPAVVVPPLSGIGTFASTFPPESTSSIPTSSFSENIRTTCPGTKSLPSITKICSPDLGELLIDVSFDVPSDAVDVALFVPVVLVMPVAFSVPVALAALLALEVVALLLLVEDVALAPSVALLPDVDVALAPAISLQSAEAVVVSLLAEAVPVSLSVNPATSVSVISLTEIVGVVSEALSADATPVSPEISAVPRSQITRPSNSAWTSAVEVLPSVVALAEVVEVALVCSPALAASSSNVVWSLSLLCAYIEMPVKAVDITATADKIDSNRNFVFLSLNNPTQTECHQKAFNKLFSILNKISSNPS